MTQHTNCPNCGESWSIEEFDTQHCGCCGFPENDGEDSDLDIWEDET